MIGGRKEGEDRAFGWISWNEIHHDEQEKGDHEDTLRSGIVYLLLHWLSSGIG